MKRAKSMKTRILTFAAGLCALAAITSTTSAVTVYVDQRNGSPTNSPYNTIQAAINASDSDVIIVMPGTYNESLWIPKSVKIYGYDGPHTTKVIGSGAGSAVSVQQGLNVSIEGLNLSSGGSGVYFAAASGSLYLRNCIICGNTSHGIWFVRTTQAAEPYLFVYNCILAANVGSGLYWDPYVGNYYYYPNVQVYNTIFAANSRYAIEVEINSINDGSMTLDYNDYVGNGLGQFNHLIGPGLQFSEGPHSLSIAPAFVGGNSYQCNQDFRLLPSSPCKDAGLPGLGFLDPDGTRNDIGAYGGPGAQSFYTNPNDGPVIRSVTIDQGMVPKGSTFTIRATGAVR
jgi:hypothetical protein